MEYRDALKALSRLSPDGRAQLFKELHFGMYTNARAEGCGIRHQQRPRSVAFPAAPEDGEFQELGATSSSSLLGSVMGSARNHTWGNKTRGSNMSSKSRGSQWSQRSSVREGKASKAAREFLEATERSLGIYPEELGSTQGSRAIRGGGLNSSDKDPLGNSSFSMLSRSASGSLGGTRKKLQSGGSEVPNGYNAYTGSRLGSPNMKMPLATGRFYHHP